MIPWVGKQYSTSSILEIIRLSKGRTPIPIRMKLFTETLKEVRRGGWLLPEVCQSKTVINAWNKDTDWRVAAKITDH